jgi:hypothetical protein
MKLLDRVIDLLKHPTGVRGITPPRVAGLGLQRSLITGKAFPVATFGFRGIEDEAAFLRKMVEATRGDLSLKELALNIVRDASVESRDELGQAAAIGKWAQENIYYVHEAVEFFQRPKTTLRLKAGDCDDFTTLIVSLLQTLGIGGRLVLMKVNGRWAHIFPVAVVNIRGKGMHRVPLDATLRRNEHHTEDFPSPVAIAQKRGDSVEILEA